MAETESPRSFGSSASVISIFLSLLLVIGIVLMLAYLMRRFNVTQGGSSQLQVVASMMVGTRERILVLQVGEEQHMVGITGHNINHLAKLDTPLTSENPGQDFKAKLAQMMNKNYAAQSSKNPDPDNESGNGKHNSSKEDNNG